MKKKIANILIILIFAGCSSSKQISSIDSINKRVHKIEKKLSLYQKQEIYLEKVFYLFHGIWANAYKKESKIIKIEYHITYWTPSSLAKANNKELERMRYEEDLISIVGEIYLYAGKPILIKEKIRRDLGFWSGMGKNRETGKYEMVTLTMDDDFKVYIHNWEESKITIENLYGSFNKQDFKKDFYNDIIEEVKKQK